MKIGSISENLNIEKRISITPEIVKKYLDLGFEIYLSENYGSHLGIKDEQFRNMGVKILKDEKEILILSDIIVQLRILSDDKLLSLKENQTLVGVLNPYDNKEKLENIAKKKLIFFHLNCFQELQERNLWIYYLLRLILLVIKRW